MSESPMKPLISIATNPLRGKTVHLIHLMLAIGITSHEVVPVARAGPQVEVAVAAQRLEVVSIAV
jgi:hypothetical protein